MKQMPLITALTQLMLFFKNGFIFLLLISFYTSCKKSAFVTPTTNNSEFKATVILSSGDTVKINAPSFNIKMGCGIFGGGTFVDGTSDANAAVYITIFDPTTSIHCVNNPGTYPCTIQYRKNVTDLNTPIFEASNQGSTTFTKINEHYMEGFFNAVCKCIAFGCVLNVESVVVAGIFKGSF